MTYYGFETLKSDYKICQFGGYKRREIKMIKNQNALALYLFLSTEVIQINIRLRLSFMREIMG